MPIKKQQPELLFYCIGFAGTAGITRLKEGWFNGVLVFVIFSTNRHYCISGEKSTTQATA